MCQGEWIHALFHPKYNYTTATTVLHHTYTTDSQLILAMDNSLILLVKQCDYCCKFCKIYLT